MVNEIKVSKIFYIKTKSNIGDLSKQYFFIASSDTMETSLIIRKLLLVDNKRKFPDDLKIIKTFKDKFLVEQRFSIKMSSLNSMIKKINLLEQSDLMYRVFC